MARIYYKNDDGDYIRDDDGNYMTGEPDDCCCEGCVPGEEPTASFTYEQTSDDPCTINLFDESTLHPNCDGEIVAWKWYLNDDLTPFSTDQNPTGIVLEDGDEIRLWVKDSCGCTDEVIGAIDCVPMRGCEGVCEPMPDFVTIIPTGSSFPCDGSRVLSGDFAPCNWSGTSGSFGWQLGWDFVGVSDKQLTLSVGCGGTGAIFKGPVIPITDPCRGTIVMPRTGGTCCPGVSAYTVTL